MHFRDAYDPARALEAAWGAIRREPLTLLLGGLLLFLFDDDNGPGIAARFADLDESWAPVVVFFALVSAGWALVFLAFSSWLYAGFARALERTLAEGRSSPAELFADRDRWWRAALATLLQAAVAIVALLPVGLIVLVGLVLTEGLGWLPSDAAAGSVLVAVLVYAPVWVYVMLGVALARPAAVVEGLGPVEALKRSWGLVRGHRLWLLLCLVLLVCVLLSGLLLCCVGVVFTSIWTETAWLESYLSLVRGEERGAWGIAGEPPRGGADAPGAG